MKENDRYVNVDDMKERIVIEKVVPVVDRKGVVEYNVVCYHFEGTERSFNLPDFQFKEVYRPYSELDVFLNGDQDESESR